MTADAEHLADYLEQEYQLAEHLYRLMQQEQDALASHDLRALQELQQQSASAVNQLQTQATLRLQWMQEQHYPLAAACLDHPSLQPAANLRRLWTRLEKQYQLNQTLSAVLAEVVLSARHRTQQKLKILRGQQNDPHLYNDKGEASRLRQGQGYIQV